MRRKKSRLRGGKVRSWFSILARSALALAALGLLMYAGLDLIDTAMKSDMFMIGDVSVEGNCMLSDDEILRALDIPSVIHLWQIDPSVLEMRVESITPVRTAKVERVFPQALSISVEERVPIVDWKNSESRKTFAVDEDGVILAEATQLETRGIEGGSSRWTSGHRPLLTGLEGDDSGPGDRISDRGTVDILKALNLTLSQDAHWIRSLVEVRAPMDSRGWILRCSSFSGDLVLGDRRFVERIGRIEPALRFLAKERIEVAYIDLRFDGQGVLIKPINCDPDDWVEVASKYPEPERGRDPV